MSNVNMTASSFQAQSIIAKVKEAQDLEQLLSINASSYRYKFVVDVSFYKSQKKARVMKPTGGTLVQGSCLGKSNSAPTESLRWSAQSGAFYVGHNQLVMVKQEDGTWKSSSWTNTIEHMLRGLSGNPNLGVLRYVPQGTELVVDPELVDRDVVDVSYFANTGATFVNGLHCKLNTSSVVPNMEFAEGYLSKIEVYFNDVEESLTTLPYERDGVHQLRMDLINCAINVVYEPKVGMGNLLADAASKASVIGTKKLAQLRSQRNVIGWNTITGPASVFAIKPKAEKSAWTPKGTSPSTEEDAFGDETI